VNTSDSAINPLDAFLDDVLPILPYTGQWILQFCADIGVSISHPARLRSRDTQMQSAIDIPIQLMLTLVRYSLQWILTVGALVLNALASVINNVFSLSKERALTLNEQHYLKAIFGDNVDYSVVRIQFSGIKEKLRISPQAVGNDIFMREFWGARVVYPDGTLTSRGMRLLGHEVAHVWQYQKFSAGYIGDSLMTQTLDVLGRRLGVHLSDGYDLRVALKQKRSIKQCNVEQQAVMAELIGASCLDNGGLTVHGFNRISGFELSQAEFLTAETAHAWFKQHG